MWVDLCYDADFGAISDPLGSDLAFARPPVRGLDFEVRGVAHELVI
jgi:hypothetical protein